MPRTLTRPPVARSGWQALPTYALASVLIVAVLLPVARSLQDPPRTELHFENGTSWDVGVQIVTDDGALRPIATLRRGTSRTVREVLTPGDTWQFRWTIEGREIHSSVVDDDELRAGDGVVAVPDEVASTAAAEAIPSPR
jgi:hypothetical protein